MNCAGIVLHQFRLNAFLGSIQYPDEGITEGKPRLTQVLPTTGFRAEELLHAAASVEQNSEHPLATAIVQGATERGLKLESVTGFNSFTGGGVVGKLGNREVVVGKLRFLQERGVAELQAVEHHVTAFQAEGQTAIFVALGGR